MLVHASLMVTLSSCFLQKFKTQAEKPRHAVKTFACMYFIFILHWAILGVRSEQVINALRFAESVRFTTPT